MKFLGNDQTPVENSENLVTSGGVYAALAGKQDAGADYVVAEGTSGDWYYRKWNSGEGECWRNFEMSSAISRNWGNWYYSGTSSGNVMTDAAPYPFPFISKPTVIASPNGDAFIVLSTYASGTTTNCPTYQSVRPQSTNTIAWNVDLYAVGRWK